MNMHFLNKVINAWLLVNGTGAHVATDINIFTKFVSRVMALNFSAG